MVIYTPEQGGAIDHITYVDGILLVEAGAGTGKTFTALNIVEELGVKSGIYTAFNKAIVEEAREKFANTPVECKTFHSLAYKYVRPKLQISHFSYKCITEKLTYGEKRVIIDALDTYSVSDSTCMFEYFEEFSMQHPISGFMKKLAAEYVQKMADNVIAPTFNFLLKCLHLMLAEKTVVITTDIVIMDEINDVTAVSLEIFKLINAPKKLGIGETHQAIYEFLNLVNGFEKLKDEATTMRFTQSYRCSEKIAERIEHKMRKVMDKNFRFTGTEKPCINGKTLYCTLTNSAIVNEIQNRVAEDKGFTLLRSPSDIFAAALAVTTASQGKKPYQAKYAYLLDVYADYKDQEFHRNFYAFLLAELDDEEINNAVKLLQRLKTDNVNIYDLYNTAKNAKPDPNYTISTVFTSKGLEFETVYICDDLNTKFESACNGTIPEDEALIAMRCYYVACSRCGVKLHNSLL